MVGHYDIMSLSIPSTARLKLERWNNFKAIQQWNGGSFKY
jgi:hypothetical protein